MMLQGQTTKFGLINVNGYRGLDCSFTPMKLRGLKLGTLITQYTSVNDL